MSDNGDLFMLAMFSAVTAPMDEEAIERERQADAKQRGDEAVAFRLLDGQIREGAKKERQADAAKRAAKKKFEAKLFQQNAERNLGPSR